MVVKVMNDINYLICKHTGMRISEVIHLSKIEKAFILAAIQLKFGKFGEGDGKIS